MASLLLGPREEPAEDDCQAEHCASDIASDQQRYGAPDRKREGESQPEVHA